MTQTSIFATATPSHPRNLPLYAVASGKGGVGKTSLTLNMATLLVRQGKKVLLVDADTGLANLDVQLNLHPPRDLAHVLSGQASVAEVATLVPPLEGATGELVLIPGRAGHAGLASASLPALTRLLNDVTEYAHAAGMDMVLMDVAAGISPSQLIFCAHAQATLLVATPDPSSLTDAYALVKLLWQHHGVANARLLMNMATTQEAEGVWQRLNTALQTFLNLPAMPLLGTVPMCKAYAAAVRNHQLAAVTAPHTAAMAALEQITKQL